MVLEVSIVVSLGEGFGLWLLFLHRVLAAWGCHSVTLQGSYTYGLCASVK